MGKVEGGGNWKDLLGERWTCGSAWWLEMTARTVRDGKSYLLPSTPPEKHGARALQCQCVLCCCTAQYLPYSHDSTTVQYLMYAGHTPIPEQYMAASHHTDQTCRWTIKW